VSGLAPATPFGEALRRLISVLKEEELSDYPTITASRVLTVLTEMGWKPDPSHKEIR
jgi:hypothetical protein